jgi:hypothetical protein
LGLFVCFQQTANDFAQLSQAKLLMPVLAIGGERANGDALGQQVKVVASDATVVVLKNTGHWVLEENPRATTDALIKVSITGRMPMPLRSAPARPRHTESLVLHKYSMTEEESNDKEAN